MPVSVCHEVSVFVLILGSHGVKMPPVSKVAVLPTVFLETLGAAGCWFLGGAWPQRPVFTPSPARAPLASPSGRLSEEPHTTNGLPT